MKNFEIIEPKEIDMPDMPDENPDYIPVYLEIEEPPPKYVNVIM